MCLINCEGKQKTFKLQKTSCDVRSISLKMGLLQSLILFVLLYLTRSCTEAKSNFESDIYTSSGELINVFKMEQELVRIYK